MKEQSQRNYLIRSDVMVLIDLLVAAGMYWIVVG